MQPVKTAVFMGSKVLGLNVLRALVKASPGLQWAVIHPNDLADPRSAYPEFVEFAEDRGLQLLTADTASAAKKLILDLRPDVGFVCCWYWLIDAETLDAIPSGLWGAHNSLLPKYRGGAPLVWSIMNGDSVVGTTVFRISEGMDDGDVLLQIPVELTTGQDISHALAAIDSQLVELLPATWAELVAGTAPVAAQDHTQATYCGQRAEEDGRIDWGRPAVDVHNFIRAQAPPYPGAFTYLADKKIKILRAEVFDGVYFGTPGQILRRGADSVLVSCGQNTALEILAVDAETPASVLRSVRDRLA